MSNDRVTTVSEAVHKLQVALLDGVGDEGRLFAAGSLMSRSDYEDVVTERSISNLCGYPLCSNALPSERPRKGHYRISLKEHKVYDLHETYMYCCSSCLINSRAFGGSLQDQRCSVMNPAKISEILSLFENVGLEAKEQVDESKDLGPSKLKIQEKTDVGGGEVSLEEWIGPSNAIEGYVPQRDRKSKQVLSKISKEGSEPGIGKSSNNDTDQRHVDFKVAVLQNEDTTGPTKVQGNEISSRTSLSQTSKSLVDEMNFTSTILTNDEYTVSKKLDDDAKHVRFDAAKEGSKPKASNSKKGKGSLFSGVDFMSTIITQDEYSISKSPSSQVKSDPDPLAGEFLEKLDLGGREKQLQASEESGLAKNGSQSSVIKGSGVSTIDGADLHEFSYHSQKDVNSSTSHVEKAPCTEQTAESSKTTAKSSLKTSKSGKAARSVSWADEKNNGLDSGNLCEFREFQNAKEGVKILRSQEAGENDDPQRFASAEACAMALTQAAEAVASGQSEMTDAVSEAGIIVLPQPQQADERENAVEDDALEEDTATPKWPKKPGNLYSDPLDSKDSWFDTPPEGFGLTLSPFAMMWDALFSWMTCSSLAFIYGRDGSSHEEYLSVNGREYPGKVVLPDGRSSEIKQTLAGCLARALPGLIAVLKLPTPVSTLEQGLACLLDTMSFMDALPPFRVKQWQVIALLFIDALSICRIPGLTPHLTSRRILIPKVLDGAQISAEEYEIMKDVVIPLGRVPQFSMQSGG